ncbi:PREDICTED: uncharacterized protein LOC104759437 [Camelina sativa]|uniref:Uncharacterized protein LOC104759437 n=1 Tax=Camelina sativa TaxID=90675 RepID=A0ABM0X4S8_CAMSA|nr:PREDICTED: uncharacterized protein LOC104759437 [Camelina sativa]
MTSPFRYPAFPSGSMKEASPEEAVAVRAVFWEMSKCPLPVGFDPRLVVPCIKLYLEKYGYHGPFSIFAFGVLDDVPIDILRGFYSTGIALTNVPNCEGFGIGQRIFDFTDKNPRPATIVALSDGDLKITNFIRRVAGYNLLEPKFGDILSLSRDSVILPHGQRGDPHYWDCLVCQRDPPSQDFDEFTAHLSSEEHQGLRLGWLPDRPRCVPSAPLPLDSHPAFATRMPGEHSWDQEPVLTKVLWDINGCPVPSDFHPLLVGPCIKRFLEDSSYPRPFSIVAIGLLSDVPEDTLRALSSTGIILHNVAYSSGGLEDLYFELTEFCEKPPANFIVIAPPSDGLYHELYESLDLGCTTSLKIRETLPCEFLGDTAAFEEALEEDKGSEAGESAYWFCSVCCHGHAFQGIENFITHLSGRAHQRKILDHLPRAERVSRPDRTTRQVLISFNVEISNF